MRSLPSSLLPRGARAAAVLLVALSPVATAGCDPSPALLMGPISHLGVLAIDGQQAYVTVEDFFAEVSAAGKVTGRVTIFEVPVAGGAPRRLAALEGAPITDIAVRASTIYFATAGNGTVSALPLGTLQVRTIASGQEEPWAVAVDGTHVYFTTRGTRDRADGTVVRAPLAGGPLEVVATGLRAPMHLALDDTSVYATVLGTRAHDYLDSSIVKIPKGGGPAGVLAVTNGWVAGLAVNGTSLYWASVGPRGDGGQLVRIDRAGGRPVVLASGQGSPAGLAVGRDAVFWTCWDGKVRQVGKRGGAISTVSSGQERPHAIAVGAAAVVWENLGKIDGERELPGALMALRR